MSGTGRRRKFVVAVDSTPECVVAVRFAARRARNTGGRVTLVCISEPEEFHQWRGVAEIMRDEARAEAERLIYEAAKAVNELSGILPELVILEGSPTECLVEFVKSDPDISILVLAASAAREGPGPLVAAFAACAGANPVPITIVPGRLSEAQVDALA
jgi:nucleotide-binding universal stress UspA family protein